jgi:hypothetical protein
MKKTNQEVDQMMQELKESLEKNKIKNYLKARQMSLSDASKILHQKFEDNFMYAYKWYSQELYLTELELSLIKETLYRCDSDGRWNEKEATQSMIDQLQKYVEQSYNIRENSTSASSREASHYEYFGRVEFIGKLKNLIA